jgi:hypothetical protein
MGLMKNPMAGPSRFVTYLPVAPGDPLISLDGFAPPPPAGMIFPLLRKSLPVGRRRGFQLKKIVVMY